MDVAVYEDDYQVFGFSKILTPKVANETDPYGYIIVVQCVSTDMVPTRSFINFSVASSHESKA